MKLTTTATFTFGRADLSPMDYSMIVKGGKEGFASVVRGSYNIYDPSGEPTGYTDGAYSALIDALKVKRIAGAGLDVFDEEPLPLDHPLRKLDNVTLSPHTGYVSDSNYEVRFDLSGR